MSRRLRLHPTVPLDRVLHLATMGRADPYGQLDLFPEPPPPDRYSASQVTIRYTLVQMRVARIALDLPKASRMALMDYSWASEALLERCEEQAAQHRLYQDAELRARIA